MATLTSEEFGRRIRIAERACNVLVLRDHGQADRAFKMGLYPVVIRDGDNEAYLAGQTETDVQHALRRVGGQASRYLGLGLYLPVRLTPDYRLETVTDTAQPCPPIPADLI